MSYRCRHAGAELVTTGTLERYWCPRCGALGTVGEKPKWRKPDGTRENQMSCREWLVSFDTTHHMNYCMATKRMTREQLNCSFRAHATSMGVVLTDPNRMGLEIDRLQELPL